MQERRWESRLDRRLRYYGWLAVFVIALAVSVWVLVRLGVRVPAPAPWKPTGMRSLR